MSKEKIKQCATQDVYTDDRLVDKNLKEVFSLLSLIEKDIMSSIEIEHQQAINVYNAIRDIRFLLNEISLEYHSPEI